MNPIKVDINDLDKYFVKSELGNLGFKKSSFGLENN